MDQALQFKELMKYDSSLKETAKLLTAQVLVKDGKFEEAVKYAEDGIEQLLDLWGEAADVVMAALLIDVLWKAGKLDKALSVVNATLKKCEELNIEGFASKAELLRLKAKILFKQIQHQLGQKILAKPAVPVPQDEASLFHVDNIAVHLNFNEMQNMDGTSNCNNQFETQMVCKPLTDLVQVELLLQHASQLANQKSLFIVELRCAMDAAEMWLAFGDDIQKLQALHTLEVLYEQMKEKAQQLEEYQIAHKLIADLKCAVCLFPTFVE